MFYSYSETGLRDVSTKELIRELVRREEAIQFSVSHALSLYEMELMNGAPDYEKYVLHEQCSQFASELYSEKMYGLDIRFDDYTGIKTYCSNLIVVKPQKKGSGE